MELGKGGRLRIAGRAAGNIDPRFYIALRCLIYSGMGMLMSCSWVLDRGAPFGMAMVACSGPGFSGVSALVGASAGYLLGGGLGWDTLHSGLRAHLYHILRLSGAERIQARVFHAHGLGGGHGLYRLSGQLLPP